MNIFEWLKAPEGKYTEGVALYKQFKKDKTYIQFFKQVETSEPGDQHFDILKKQLARIARIHGQNAAEKTVKTKPIAVKPIEIKGKRTSSSVALAKDGKKPAGKPTPGKKHLRIVEEFNLINPKDLPKNLQIVFFDIKARFGEMKELHNKIKHAKSADNVKELTENLVGLEEINYKEWGKIDEWAKNPNTDKKKDGGRNAFQEFQENERRIESVKINVSRANKELKKLNLDRDAESDPKKLKKLDKKIKYRKSIIPEWEKELETLKQRQAEIKAAK